MRSFTLLFFLIFNVLFAQKEYAFDIDEIRARNFFNQGLGYLQDNSFEAAIRKFLDSLKIKNNDNLVRYYLGEAFYKAGYTQQALDQWENILKLGGQDAQLIDRINNIYYLRGKKKERKAFEDYVYINAIPTERSTNSSSSLISYPIKLHIDAKNELYFLDYKQNKIGRIGPNGRYIGDYFGGLSSVVPGLDKLKRPVDFIYYKDKIIVSDFGNDRLAYINKKDGLYKTLGKKGINSVKLLGVEWLGPSGLVEDELGNFFVVDTGNCRVNYLNLKGELLFSFGQRGSDGGDLLLPSGIAYNRKKREVYVCDRGNNRINVYDAYGNYRGAFGSSFLKKPRQIVTHPFDKDVLIIVDSKDVYLYNNNRHIFKSIFYNVSASPPPKISPISATFDNAGHLYVGDANEGRIHVYAPLKLKYVNLNVRIENIVVRKFPEILVSASVYNKEGLPIVGLNRDNFELTENEIIRNSDLYKLGDEYQFIRGAILIERSQNSQSREHLLNGFIRDFLLHLSDKDHFDFYNVGYDTDPNRSYHKVIDKRANFSQVISAIDQTPYYKYVQFGTPLKSSINNQLQSGHKRGILMVVFSDYTESAFYNENYLQLIDFAKHNFVPISVVYLGEKTSQSDHFVIFRSIAEKTGGQFFIYSNKEHAKSLVRGFRSFEDGRYFLRYTSFENSFKSGLFRKLGVKVKYKGLTGFDNKGGFPIP